RHLGLLLLLAVGCGNQTICASEDALALDLHMGEVIEQAVAYWDDRGWRGVVAVGGTSCDAPVTVDVNLEADARTDVTEPFYDRTDCWTNGVRLNPRKWLRAIESGSDVRVMAHEV